MFYNKCGSAVVADAKFCSSCGGALNQVSPIRGVLPAHKVVGKSSDGFFIKLSRGNYGLAKTYWLYGAVVGVIANIVIVFSTILSPAMFAMVILAYTAYEILVIMGTWRSATKYTGPKVWAVLAKIACIFGALGVVYWLLVLMKNA